MPGPKNKKQKGQKKNFSPVWIFDFYSAVKNMAVKIIIEFFH